MARDKTTDLSGAAADKVQLAHERDRQVTEALNAARGSGATVAELSARLSLLERACRRAVARLVAAGIVVKSGPRYVLAGALPDAITLRTTPELDTALTLLPTDVHRAASRLLLYGTVAKWHLAATLTTGWPSLWLYGQTRSGKTLTATIAARVLGLDPAATIRLVGTETSRSLFGRRTPQPGAGWTFTPSRSLSQPVLCLDELDKADSTLRRQVLLLAQGDSRVFAEDQPVAVRAAVMGTFNTRQDEAPFVLHPAYQRRGATANLWSVHGSLAGIDAIARRILAPGVLPSVKLASLRPVSALPEDVMARFGQILHTWMTADGWELTDPTFLSKFALGATAFVGSGDRATLIVAADVLTLASTEGRTKNGWQAALDALLAGAPPDPRGLRPADPDSEPEPEGLPWSALLVAYVAGYADGAEDDHPRLSARAAERACCGVVGEPLAIAQAARYEVGIRRHVYARGRDDGQTAAGARRAEAERERERGFWLQEAGRHRQDLKRELAAMGR